MAGLVARLARVVAVVALFAVVVVGGPGVESADAQMTTAVTTAIDESTDNGECSLREAILLVNGSQANDDCGSAATQIAFNSPMTVNVVSDLPPIAEPVVIIGFNRTVIGNGSSQLFQIDTGGSVRIEDLGIENGSAATGGAVLVASGDVTLERVSLIGNSATTDGGAIHVGFGANVTVRDSILASNTAEGDGGGIYVSDGRLLVDSSAILNNTATQGGGLRNNSSSAVNVVVNSTISGNTASAAGGGIRNIDGTLTVLFSTVTNNSAPQGAGVWTWSDAFTDTQIAASIVAANDGGDGNDLFSLGAVDNYATGCFNVIGTVSTVSAFPTGGGCDVGEAGLALAPLDDSNVHQLGIGTGVDLVTAAVNTFGVTEPSVDQLGRDDFGRRNDAGAYENQRTPQGATAREYRAVTGSELVVDAADGLLGGFSDVEGDPLTARLGNVPRPGSVAVNADGSFTYQAPASVGTEDFTFFAEDRPGGPLYGATVTVVEPACVLGAAFSVNESISQAECDALVALYTATGGSTDWSSNDGWVAIDDGGQTDPCDWPFIECTDGRLTSLSSDRAFRGNNLTGSIPAELGDLVNLQILDLARNNLTGSIPAELGDLASLETLDFQANSLSGSIPATLGDLQGLKVLNLSNNDSVPGSGLSGSIPSVLADLESLKSLNLRGNSLSGSIPAELGGLSNLETLSLSANSLSGSIPAELGGLSNLETLSLSGNSLSGSIPAELGDLENLKSLSLEVNSLSGSIPPELGDLTNVQQVSLSRNRLSGLLPGELERLAPTVDFLGLFDNDGCLTIEASTRAVLDAQLRGDFGQLPEFGAGCDPVDDAAVVAVGDSVLIDVLGNDVMTSSHEQQLSIAAAPAEGTAEVEGDQIRYTPAAAAAASSVATFDYQACSGDFCATAAVSVTVEAPAISSFCNGLAVTIDLNVTPGATGTAGDDVIFGTPGNDVINGLGGEDTICGQGGDDMINGGGDKDFIFGGEGNDIMFGGDGNDRIRGNQGEDTIDGEEGNDFLYGGIDADTISGGEGRDTIGGFGGADTINGGPGNDTVFGGFGADIINGGDGNDTINGLIGNDIISGGAGNDTLNGDQGQDTINGDAGDDVINGGNSLDTLFGDAGDDSVNGGKANDSLSGGDGNDTCSGNKDIDTADNTCELQFGIP